MSGFDLEGIVTGAEGRMNYDVDEHPSTPTGPNTIDGSEV